jgi:hypothetical protein
MFPYCVVTGLIRNKYVSIFSERQVQCLMGVFRRSTVEIFRMFDVKVHTIPNSNLIVKIDIDVYLSALD